MKPLFKCNFCPYFGEEEDVTKHEKECLYNPEYHCCGNCTHARRCALSENCAVIDIYRQDTKMLKDSHYLCYGNPKKGKVYSDDCCENWEFGKPVSEMTGW